MNLLSKIFNKKKKTEKTNIIAPITGKIINIESVPDEIFSKKIVGDGLAIFPSGNKIVSPVLGTIGKIFKTMHAFSIITNNGIELLIHFGIDTILLKGKGFKKKAKSNQMVNIGDTIIEYDLKFLSQHAKSIITPIIISNTDQIQHIKKYSGNVIAGKTKIMEIIK